MHACSMTGAEGSGASAREWTALRLTTRADVQFMQRHQDEEDVAVDCFLSRGAFERELESYQDARLRAVLVPVLHGDNNESGDVRTRSGYVFPPYIVVERGEVPHPPLFA